jgi:hypothetical protein
MSRVEDDDSRRRADVRAAEKLAQRQKWDKRNADAAVFEKSLERHSADDEAVRNRAQFAKGALARRNTVREIEGDVTDPGFEMPPSEDVPRPGETLAQAALREAVEPQPGGAAAQVASESRDPSSETPAAPKGKEEARRADAQADAKGKGIGRAAPGGRALGRVGERGDKKGDQGGQGKKKQPDGSFKIPPSALMAPPPLAQPKDSSPASKLRALAQEIINRIVERVRVGSNAEGLPEFQLELHSSVLAGLLIKVSSNRGRIRAVFSSHDPAVLKALRGGAKELTDALSARGIPLEALEFEAR